MRVLLLSTWSSLGGKGGRFVPVSFGSAAATHRVLDVYSSGGLSYVLQQEHHVEKEAGKLSSSKLVKCSVPGLAFDQFVTRNISPTFHAVVSALVSSWTLRTQAMAFQFVSSDRTTTGYIKETKTTKHSKMGANLYI